MKTLLVLLIIVLVLALVVIGVVYMIYKRLSKKVIRFFDKTTRQIGATEKILGSAVKATNHYGGTKQLFDMVADATKDEMERPKTLSGTEPVHRMSIKKDFPEMNIELAKNLVKNFLPNFFQALSTGNVKNISDKANQQLCDRIVSNYESQKLKYQDVKVHNVVISDYKKSGEEANIYFEAAVGYKLSNKNYPQQEKYKITYTYYLDYGAEGENASLVCKVCGAPIEVLGAKKCPYCDAVINASIVRTWKITDVKLMR